jgi:hypothetical protein
MKRTIALGVAWTASAAAAVGLGFLAVSLVDASASPATDNVAATTSAPTGSATPTAPAPGATSGEHVTVGGTVFASCIGGVPSLAGAPAPGWRVDDSNDPGEVEFKNGTHKVEVHTVCVGDVPRFSDEGLRADGSGRGNGSGSPSSSSGSPSSTSGRDDSGDDNSGPGSDNSGSGNSGSDHSGGGDHSGSGSDDSGRDDSSGRGGGGHGSDD